MLEVGQYFVNVVRISFLACDFVFEIVRGVLNTLVIIQIYGGQNNSCRLRLSQALTEYCPTSKFLEPDR
jgi:hypothetical protein